LPGKRKPAEDLVKDYRRAPKLIKIWTYHVGLEKKDKRESPERRKKVPLNIKSKQVSPKKLYHHPIKVPVCADELFNPSQYRVYCALLHNVSAKNEVDLSVHTLSKKCKLSENNVRDCLKFLGLVHPAIKSSFISVSIRYAEDGGRLPNLIKILDIQGES
jgi:hypothetical protein